ncbi:MAG: UvrD-helicase domain-containing protein [Lysobacterales bacterium]
MKCPHLYSYNDQQRATGHYTKASLLVLAGAGSGKTAAAM